MAETAKRVAPHASGSPRSHPGCGARRRAFRTNHCARPTSPVRAPNEHKIHAPLIRARWGTHIGAHHHAPPLEARGNIGTRSSTPEGGSLRGTAPIAISSLYLKLPMPVRMRSCSYEHQKTSCHGPRRSHWMRTRTKHTLDQHEARAQDKGKRARRRAGGRAEGRQKEGERVRRLSRA